MILRPAESGEAAVRRSIWPIGIYTLLNLNLFSWYLLWLLPLLAIFMGTQTLRFSARSRIFAGLQLTLPRLDAWTGWWLFTGLVALSYTYFIRWSTLPLARGAQFWPLYAFLALDLLRWLRPPNSLHQWFRTQPLNGGLEQ